MESPINPMTIVTIIGQVISETTLGLYVPENIEAEEVLNN